MRRMRVGVSMFALFLFVRPASAQVREQPVPFDSAGRVSVITPPLAARLGLSAPLWPVTGDYIDARLYALGDTARAFVLVVRRPRDILDRFPVDSAMRAELASAIARSTAVARERAGPDTAPTVISEPVRGAFVLNQSLLGVFLFAPYTAALTNDPALGSAAYLLVSGGMFFVAANISKSTPVSRAQNHLSWHASRQGSIAASLALFAIGSESVSGRAYAASLLAGGVAGDIIGFKRAKPMTDAEAHGTSHGATVAALLTAGVLGTTGMFSDESSGRAAAALVVAGGAAGYPFGLRYSRRVPYRVTAGDVGALVTTELLGVAAASTILADTDPSDEAVFGVLTAGYALGLVVGDRLLVRRFDHTDAEARLLLLGTVAGGVMGAAIPALAETDSDRGILAAQTIGAILGALVAENMIEPRREGAQSRAGLRSVPARFGIRFSPEGILALGMRRSGHHSILSVAF